MKITKSQMRRIIKEAQFGRFTGGAAPLDVPMRDSGPVPKDQLRKLADIFMNDMGMSPEEVLSKPEFMEQGITNLRQLKEGKMKITKRQLRQIIREALDEGKCDKASGHEGCVRKRDKGWVVLSNKTGKPWRGGGEKDGDIVYYDSEAAAKKALGAYHG